MDDDSKTTPFLIRLLSLFGAIVYGIGSLWICTQLINYANQTSNQTRFFTFIGIALIVVTSGVAVFISALKPRFFRGDDITDIPSKPFNLSADKIMIIAAIISVILMAAYIYFVESGGIQ